MTDSLDPVAVARQQFEKMKQEQMLEFIQQTVVELDAIARRLERYAEDRIANKESKE